MRLIKAKKLYFLSIILTIILSALTFSSAVSSADSKPSLLLFKTIDERLGYMKDVALFKAQNQIQVEDIEREKIVLSNAKKLAVRHGLDPNSMEHFFIVQINVAKAIQYRFRAELLTLEMPARSVDLESNIRPALDQLGSDIVALFATLLQNQSAVKEESRKIFIRTLQSQSLSEVEREALFNAMLEVRSSQ